jgi:hypothetical protein
VTLYRRIDNDPDELAGYVDSLGSGLVVFDGRDGDGKTYMARQMQRRLARCKAIDADCCFLVPDQQRFRRCLATGADAALHRGAPCADATGGVV